VIFLSLSKKITDPKSMTDNQKQLSHNGTTNKWILANSKTSDLVKGGAFCQDNILA
jgi:hypothetical protein